MSSTLYVSIDGVLGQLGFGQVFRVVEGLTRRGLSYSLVSLEKRKSLEDRTRVAAVAARARQSGIDWRWGVYEEGGAVSAVAENMARLGALASSLAVRHRARVVHARGYHGAMAALAIAAALRRKWVFDARGYWIDERLEESRWFTTPARLAAARAVERRLYGSSDAVVTLTQLHADDLGRGDPEHPRGSVVVIPTCADFDEFRPRDEASLDLIPVATRRHLWGKHVIGVVGSLNRAYLGPQTARLATRVLERRADAHVLVLSSQRDEWTSVFSAAGAPMERVTIVRADHEAMPQWLNLLTWALLLLAPASRAKRGAMPTKLAEFFATGVRVCAHGCSEEVTDWVQRAGGGLVLASLDDASIEQAAVHLANTVGRAPETRERTRPYFSLESGLDRYERLIASLLD